MKGKVTELAMATIIQNFMTAAVIRLPKTNRHNSNFASFIYIIIKINICV